MMARWGMPSPVFALKDKHSDPGVTNVRNVKSPHWRRWLGIENRGEGRGRSVGFSSDRPEGCVCLPAAGAG